MIMLVTGLPGSGKSFFASRLATKLDAAYISSDKVRKDLDLAGHYTPADKFAVYLGMPNLADHFLKKGKIVVADATFYRQTMRDIFTSLAKQHSTSVCLIYVTADEPLLKERLSQRREDSEANWQVYQQIRDEFEKFTAPHLLLQSTNNNITSMLDKALIYIQQKND